MPKWRKQHPQEGRRLIAFSWPQADERRRSSTFAIRERIRSKQDKRDLISRCLSSQNYRNKRNNLLKTPWDWLQGFKVGTSLSGNAKRSENSNWKLWHRGYRENTTWRRTIRPKAEDATPNTMLAVGTEALAEEKEEDKGWDDRKTKTKTKPDGKWIKQPKAEKK